MLQYGKRKEWKIRYCPKLNRRVWMFKMNKTIIVLVHLFCYAHGQKCIHRDFGFDGTVCVCNSTYCDTIEPEEILPVGKYQIYTSTKAGLRFEKSTGDFMSVELVHGEQVTINTAVTYQKIIGFGGAFSDAVGINLNSLNDMAKEKLMRAYFGSEGIQYNICRLPIGGTDFSTHGYSYEDGDADANLSRFKLDENDYVNKLPLLKMANEIIGSPLRLIASAWTAPKWMKTNNDYWGFGFLKDEFYQTWADYHIKFLDAYANEGIKFWGITTGNEPLNSLVGFITINSVGWTPDGVTRWIAEHFGPTLRASNHSDLILMALDDQRFLLPVFMETVLKNKKAYSYVDGVAVHWYLDRVSPPFYLTRQHRLYPEKFMLQTEASIGDRPWEFVKVCLGCWSRGERYSSSIFEYLKNWVTGWMDWNIALNMDGGPTYIRNRVDSPVIVNAEKGEFYKNPMFYIMGHFSKFVVPGSVRIEASYSIPNFDAIAFRRPDKSVAIVIVNRNDILISVHVVDGRNNRGFISVGIERKSFNTIIYR